MQTDKINKIMANMEADENELINLLLIGAAHVAEIAINDLKDFPAARHALEVHRIISEVRSEK